MRYININIYIKPPTIKKISSYNHYSFRINSAKNERKIDTQTIYENILVCSFDVKNTFFLPQLNVSSFYYRRKYTVHLLTLKVHGKPEIYDSVRHEGLCGRGGTHIANALIKLLKKVSNPPFLFFVFHKVKGTYQFIF